MTDSVSRIEEGPTSVRKWEAYRLAKNFIPVPEIAKKMGLSTRTVHGYIVDAMKDVRQFNLANENDSFLMAVSRMESLGQKVWQAIEESLIPKLDTRRIRKDLDENVTSEAQIGRYYRDGLVNYTCLKIDIEDGSPELAAIMKYIIPPSLDLQASALYLKVVESMRKLQGIDRDKTRVELTAKEAATAAVGDVQAEIIALARQRRLKRDGVLEIEAKTTGKRA